MGWIEQRIVAFDTETTGLNPFDGDRIIEFGAVEFTVDADYRVTGVQAHDWMFNPGIPIPRVVTRVTGIADEDVAKAPPFAKKAAEVRALLENAILIAHNFAFDMAFLRLEFARCDLHWPPTVAEIDTLRLSQAKLSELKQHRLGVVAEALDVPLDNAHRATDDAEACGRVFIEIARRQNAPQETEEMFIWADAVSPPPETGHIGIGEEGMPIFLAGPMEGKRVDQHPDHLQWMIIALERQENGWSKRFPESLHLWAQRWLRARASGRFKANPRGGSSRDWGLDPAPWHD